MRKSLSETLRQAIREYPGGVYALAGASHIPAPTIYRFLAGSRGIGLETADPLCRALGLRLVPGPAEKIPEKSSSTA